MALQCHVPRRSTKKLSSLLTEAPLDVLENVIRRSSSHPNYEHWASFLDAPDLESIVDSNKSLAETARNIVKKVEVADWPLACPGGIFLNGVCAPNRQHFCSFLAAFRSSIEDIRFTTSKFCASYCDLICCPNIKSLALSSPRAPDHFLLAMILPQIGRQLKALEVSFPVLTDVDTDAIAHFCSSLQSLSLNCKTYEVPLVAVWKRVGPVLTKLVLSHDKSATENRTSNFQKINLRTIELMCKSITSLSISHMPSSSPFPKSLCKLATSLGPQLTHMSLERCSYPPGLLKRICIQCPSVRVDLSEVCGVSKAAAISLGKHARSITMGCQPQSDNGLDGIEEVSEACEELEIVRSRCQRITCFEMFALFKYPKMRLREVHSHFWRSVDTDMTLEIVAKMAPALEVCHINGGLCSLAGLLAFVDNAESIVEIAIEKVPHDGGCRCAAEGQQEMACTNMKFANAIAVCTFSSTLRYLRLSCNRSFHRVQGIRAEEFLIPCAVARRKNISVCVCGYRYV